MKITDTNRSFQNGVASRIHCLFIGKDITNASNYELSMEVQTCLKKTCRFSRENWTSLFSRKHLLVFGGSVILPLLLSLLGQTVISRRWWSVGRWRFPRWSLPIWPAIVKRLCCSLSECFQECGVLLHTYVSWYKYIYIYIYIIRRPLFRGCHLAAKSKSSQKFNSWLPES